MRILLIIIFLFHGSIHFMGFAKAFGYGTITQLTKEISKPIGILWLVAGLLFFVSAILILIKKEGWPLLAVLAVVLSQSLIFTVWQDAKFGTIANLIILVAAVQAFASQSFENSYRKDVISAMKAAKFMNELVTETDLEPLPSSVQKYLRYVGVVGKPKMHNAKVVFEGEMRDKGKDWFFFTSEQYNFFDSPTRLFFMKAKVKGLSTHGYHTYKKEGASMLIKLFSLFPIVDIKGEEMFPTETVTFFNDLCLFAPAALIDDRIAWESLNDLSVKATFTTNGTSISAILYFNKTGQLINFISNDRYSVTEMKAFPFSTPAKNYENMNGYNLPTYGKAIWHYTDGEFVYGKVYLKSIKYNVSHLK